MRQQNRDFWNPQLKVNIKSYKMNNYTLKSVLILIVTGTAFVTQIEKINANHIADSQGYIFNN